MWILRKINIGEIQRFNRLRMRNRRISQQKKNVVYMIREAVFIAGLWLGRFGNSMHFLAWISGFCFILTTLLQLVGLFITTDPSKLFEYFSILSFIGMGFLKFLSLKIYHYGWKNILKLINDLEDAQLNVEKDQSLSDDNEYNEKKRFFEHIERYTKFCKKALTFFRVFYYFTLVFFVVSPFAEFAVSKLKNQKVDYYPHILPGWAPFDDISIYGYLTSVTVEMISSIYTVHVHISFDSISVGIMIFICGQFFLLRDYSEHIGGATSLHPYSNYRDNRGHNIIVRCSKTHVLLIYIINELDELLRSILGVYFLVASFTLCSVAVQLKTGDLSLLQLVKLLQYISATLTQLFLYCYCGDAVYQSSLMVQGQGPFGGAWYNLRPRVQKELMILGVGMYRSRKLRAGPFSSLDLPTFIQIVRAAYSYYAVISQNSK